MFEGIATACVAFIFVCIIYPRLVKNRPQFYFGFLAIVVTLFLHVLGAIFGAVEFARFIHAFSGLLLLVAFVLLVLATGGLSLRELSGEIRGAIEVVRRGETEREIIIPRSAQQQPQGSAPAPQSGSTGEVPTPPPPTSNFSSERMSRDM